MITKEAKGADYLLASLRAEGFSLRVNDEGQLLVTPASKLAKEQRKALKQNRNAIMAILEWESIEPVSGNALRDWQGGHTPVAEELPRTQTSPRRIVLLAGDGSVDSVLADPSAESAIQELRRLATEHRGRRLAAEWLGSKGWQRWIEVGQ